MVGFMTSTGAFRDALPDPDFEKRANDDESAQAEITDAGAACAGDG